ncbi:LysR family transcriptional regulator [Serratia fonticola]|uniref:LysR family transcriptional regulator n=1 Tax=Serratia fonticola TaxID=47917 RepID=A0AAJ2DAZ2_SERFO|nr:LysR family transcriptional regulator [Serratia fonticola]MDQ9125755.1 LysR family transcriptional regulator [Serratia fonticola]
MLHRNARQLTLEHMRVFVAVIEAKSFSKAGEVLGKSQPAITQIIKKLEDILALPLLLRKQGRVETPTLDGRIFYLKAKKALDSANEAYFSLRGTPFSGKLRIGVLDDFQAKYIPMLIRSCRSIYQNVELEITSELSWRLNEGFSKGELDAILNKYVYADNFSETPLSVEPLRWVAAQDFILTSTPVPLVVFHEGCLYRQCAIDALNKSETDWKIAYSSYSYSNIQEAISAGMGISPLPPRAMLLNHRDICTMSTLPSLPDICMTIKLSPSLKADRMANEIVRLIAQTFVQENSLLDHGGDDSLFSE